MVRHRFTPTKVETAVKAWATKNQKSLPEVKWDGIEGHYFFEDLGVLYIIEIDGYMHK
jgi:hypothetical protein